MACIEFEPGAGLWAVALFADSDAEATWGDPVQAAFRLLGDTGFGGSRSTGWGQAPSPECQQGDWPALLFPRLARGLRNGAAAGLSSLHWLLALYTPAPDDSVNWAEGKYALTVRGGRVESRAGWGAEKKLVRMVTEGSVVSSGASPKGQAVDVAPNRFAHPVYRAGFALALQLPVVHISEETSQRAVVEEVITTDVQVESAELGQPVVEAAELIESEAPVAQKQPSVEDASVADLPTESESLGDETPPEPVAESESTAEAPPAPESAAHEETTGHINAALPTEAAALDFESDGDITLAAENVAETPTAPPEATPAETVDPMEPTQEKATQEVTSKISSEAAPHTTADEGKFADDEL
jgi:hypothetical protein